MDTNDKTTHRRNRHGHKLFWIAVATIAVIVVLAVDNRSRVRGSFERSADWTQRAERLADRLDLSAEQQAQIEPMLAQLELTGAALEAERARIIAGFDVALRAEDGEAQLEGLRADLERLAVEAIDSGITVLAETWTVLTPTQRTEALDQWRRRR